MNAAGWKLEKRACSNFFCQSYKKMAAMEGKDETRRSIRIAE